MLLFFTTKKLVVERAGFFWARLGLGLRKVSPFGLGLWSQKNWPNRTELGPVRALLNRKLLVLFLILERTFGT